MLHVVNAFQNQTKQKLHTSEHLGSSVQCLFLDFPPDLCHNQPGQTSSRHPLHLMGPSYPTWERKEERELEEGKRGRDRE